AEDGIRGFHVTGVQTCALPISFKVVLLAPDRAAYGDLCQLITVGRRAAEKGAYRLTLEDLAKYSGRCLALWVPGDYVGGVECPQIGRASCRYRVVIAGRAGSGS